MTNEEKILDILASVEIRMGSMETRLGSMETQMGSMETRLGSMETQMGSMETQMGSMETQMGSMETRLGSMETQMGSMEGNIDSIENEVLKVNFKLETVVEPRLDALAEGHSAILERLVPRSRVDELEDRVKFLESIIRQINDELQNLKKAQ